MAAVARKTVTHTQTVEGAMDDGFGELESLGEEMREWYDNMPENFQRADKGSQVESAADALESLQRPDVPECASDVDASFESAPAKRKAIRASRRDYAVQCLSAAADAAEGWLDDPPELEVSAIDPIVSDNDVTERESQRADVEQFVGELQDAIGEAEGVDFPGMFG